MVQRTKNFKEVKNRMASDAGYRQSVFKSLLKHVRDGYSLDAFNLLSLYSIEAAIKAYPDEFCVEELEAAQRDAKCFWEGLGRKQSDGTCMGNSRSWYYNMSNRYKWTDRVQAEVEHKGNLNVSIINYMDSNRADDDVTE
jgi:hypothetical protein